MDVNGLFEIGAETAMDCSGFAPIWVREAPRFETIGPLLLEFEA